MSDWKYILAAYAVSWVTLLGYGSYLAVRGRGVRNDAVDMEHLP